MEIELIETCNNWTLHQRGLSLDHNKHINTALSREIQGTWRWCDAKVTKAFIQSIMFNVWRFTAFISKTHCWRFHCRAVTFEIKIIKLHNWPNKIVYSTILKLKHTNKQWGSKHCFFLLNAEFQTCQKNTTQRWMFGNEILFYLILVFKNYSKCSFKLWTYSKKSPFTDQFTWCIQQTGSCVWWWWSFLTCNMSIFTKMSECTLELSAFRRAELCGWANSRNRPLEGVCGFLTPLRHSALLLFEVTDTCESVAAHLHKRKRTWMWDKFLSRRTWQGVQSRYEGRSGRQLCQTDVWLCHRLHSKYKSWVNKSLLTLRSDERMKITFWPVTYKPW